MKTELLKFLKMICLFILLCVIFSVLIAVLLRTSFLSEQKVFLYRLLMIDALCCLITLAISFIIFYTKKRNVCGIGFVDSIMCIGLTTLFMALFLSLGPMTIERSYTIYSLADMTDNASKVYSAEEIKQQFIEGYIENAGESQKRIDEQVYIGNLLEVNGGYQISEKGQRLVGIFRIVEKIFPVTDKNSIYPNGY